MKTLPRITYPKPVTGGSRPEQFARMTIQRPSIWVLGIIYLLWIGYLIAAFYLPSIPVSGFIYFLMLLFIWFPYWTYRNWNDLVSDLPWICAAISVAIIIIATMQLDCWWSFSEARNGLKSLILKNHSPQLKNWDTPWQIKFIDFLPQYIMIAIMLFWKSIPNYILLLLPRKYREVRSR